MRGKAITLAVALCVLAGLSFGQSKDPNDPKILKQNVVKVLRTTNKSQVNRYVPKVYEFKNVNPGAFAHRLLSNSVKAENGLIDTYVAPDGKSGLVLVVAPEYQIPSIDVLMKQLDRKDQHAGSGTQWVYVNLKNRSAADFDVPNSLLMYGTNDNVILPDFETNSVYIQGSPSGVDSIVNKAAEYDVATAQVNVAARMYEVNVTNDGQLGHDYYAWKNGPGKALFSAGAFSENESFSPGTTQFNSGANIAGLPSRRMNNTGYNSAVMVDVNSAFFDFLAVKGKGDVVTEGSVTVLSGKPASFSATNQISYVASVPASTAPASSALQPAPGVNLQTASANDRTLASGIATVGVTMAVTPTIASDDIAVTVNSNISDLTGYDSTGKPSVGTRQVSTAVRSKSGEEIVLGGMNRVQNYKTARKMPILGSIPVLGYLFGSETTAKKNTTLVQVIQPTIVKGDGLSAAQKTVVDKVAKPAGFCADEK